MSECVPYNSTAYRLQKIHRFEFELTPLPRSSLARTHGCSRCTWTPFGWTYQARADSDREQRRVWTIREDIEVVEKEPIRWGRTPPSQEVFAFGFRLLGAPFGRGADGPRRSPTSVAVRSIRPKSVTFQRRRSDAPRRSRHEGVHSVTVPTRNADRTGGETKCSNSQGSRGRTSWWFGWCFGNKSALLQNRGKPSWQNFLSYSVATPNHNPEILLNI